MTYESYELDALPKIKHLWEKLNQIHIHVSGHFREQFESRTFEERQQFLVDKAGKGKAKLFAACEDEKGSIIGYCLGTITNDRIGEIDSLFVEADYRHQGIGDSLMKKLLGWMDEEGTVSRRLAVAEGNDAVLSFYERFGFYPRSIILEQKDDENESEMR